jgi:hypothetical protein
MVKGQLWPLLELLALTGLVVAQPLLDVIGRAPDFLLLRKADARDIVLLAVAITLLPPLALWGLELLARLLGGRVQRGLHLVLVAGLLGLLGLEVAKKATGLRGPWLLAVGVLVGLGGGLLYGRGPVFRTWLRFVWPAPAVFVLVFLLVSPAAQLLKAAPAPTAQPAGVPTSAKKGPIVMVLMDEFPLTSILDHRGDIDRRLFPNLAKLAAGSTWYRNATAVTGMTGWAVPSMMTGRYPAEDKLPITSQFPDNLFTLLGGSYGYKMRVFEGMSQLCPPATCPDAKKTAGQGGFGGVAGGGSGGFRRVLRDSAGVWTQIVSTRDSAVEATATLEDDTVADAAAAQPSADPGRRRKIVQAYKRGVNYQRFLASIRATDANKPTVHFVHVLMPHQPWKRLPSGMKYPERTFAEPTTRNGLWVPEPWRVQNTRQRHLLQAATADRMIGDLLKKLRDTGLYDDSLLVVTADHGLAFRPGEQARASVTEATAPDVLWVPMFIKRPNQRAPATNDVNWEHVDLVPTIADIMGIRVPWSMDGVSWADTSAAAKRPRTQKWFYPRPGTQRAFEGPANQAIALQGVTDRLLRPQDGYLGWFKFGPHADLVGRRVGDLASGQDAGTARVMGLDEYRRVDPDSGLVPAQVGGQLTTIAAGVPARPLLAVAVNGVIGGVSETFSSGGSPPTWFSAMVPDTLLRPGGNQLQLFVVETAGGRQRLRPLTLTG